MFFFSLFSLQKVPAPLPSKTCANMYTLQLQDIYRVADDSCGKGSPATRYSISNLYALVSRSLAGCEASSRVGPCAHRQFETLLLRHHILYVFDLFGPLVQGREKLELVFQGNLVEELETLLLLDRVARGCQRGVNFCQ
jgi:hypothetical protein